LIGGDFVKVTGTAHVLGAVVGLLVRVAAAMEERARQVPGLVFTRMPVIGSDAGGATDVKGPCEWRHNEFGVWGGLAAARCALLGCRQ
jgi:hypothetical protein